MHALDLCNIFHLPSDFRSCVLSAPSQITQRSPFILPVPHLETSQKAWITQTYSQMRNSKDFLRAVFLEKFISFGHLAVKV